MKNCRSERCANKYTRILWCKSPKGLESYSGGFTKPQTKNSRNERTRGVEIKCLIFVYESAHLPTPTFTFARSFELLSA